MTKRRARIAGHDVEIWKTSFRINGMSTAVHVGHHITDRAIEEIIHTISNSLKPQGPSTMNLKTMAALVRDDVTTLSANMRNSDTEYLFLCTRELADHIRASGGAGPVVVETSRGLGIAQVKEVHDEPQIDPEDGRGYRWAFQRVDTRELDRQVSITSALENRLKTRRKHSRREQALAALGMDPEEVKALARIGES